MTDVLDASLDLRVLLVAALVVMLAACVQASIGFAYALLAAPLLQLVSSELVPGPMLVSALMLSALTAWRERSHIDRRGVALALGGRVPGAVLAGFAIGLAPARVYDILFGSLVLIAVLICLRSRGIRPTPPALIAAGFVSGIMGTLTSVGGPPIALVYQHARGPALRSTLNAYFAIGCLISIAVLVHAGHFRLEHLLLGLAALPLIALGFYASRFTRDSIDGAHLRVAVLALAGLASLAVVIKASFFGA